MFGFALKGSGNWPMIPLAWNRSNSGLEGKSRERVPKTKGWIFLK
jgi:hypothetical protein